MYYVITLTKLTINLLDMKIIQLLVISFLLTFLWAICFIDIEADKFSCLIGFALTALFVKLLNQENLSIKNKLILLIFPIAYLFLVDFSVKNDINKIIFNPINISLLFLIIGLIKPLNKKNIVYLLILCIISIGYSYTYFPKFKSKRNITFEETSFLNKNQTVQFEKFVFYNKKNDSIKIESKRNKFIITWNKTCVPCKKAIKDLKINFSKNRNYDYYLINIPFKKGDFGVAEIESILKDSINNVYILNDDNNHFVNDLKILSVPTFLVLDENNDLVYYKIGYNSSNKKELVSLLEKK